MAEAEPNQNTSSQPVFYIGAITLPSSHLALLEFKSSDLITFHLGFNLPGKNGFWHFIWLPCTGSKWAGSLMKLFMGPATQPHSRRVNTHSALLGHPGQSWCGKIPPPPDGRLGPDYSPDGFLVNDLFTWAVYVIQLPIINAISGQRQAYIFLFPSDAW